ncbi:hypothetical protein GCM10011531_26260 [Aquaticitalea lipolytica]|uniref:DUF2157 domain-containing protein n=1 Tax=Aquaticitalea lipolytica TaxID=1247562 RepID=A0A8J2XI18_9FLAO|nr:DUF2157 domain-containing protein [Aquaticitalea lipolytica]GFZ93012.1 hypothetical protein GCM10011531_26260 [Aquaticitalea lipolytica]
MNLKLIKELPELIENKVISKEVALSIEQYYHSKQNNSPNKLFMVFGVLGSILVGLGIILILAHNWDDFTRSTKTIFAFLPLLIGQFFVGFSILKKKSATWKEASGTFLFFAVGASISLVAQIYNIPGNMSSFLLTWILLCLPLIYLLKSNSIMILHLVFITWYACSYGYSFMNYGNSPWLYLALLALSLPHYWQLLKHKLDANITSIINWLVPLSLIITLGTFVEHEEALGFLLYLLLFSLFYNIGKIPYFENQKLRRNGFLITGSLGIVTILLIASFRWLWKDIIRIDSFQVQELYMSAILFLMSILTLVYLYLKHKVKSFNIFQFVFVIFTVLFFIGINNEIVPAILVNMLIFALGVVTVKIGADKFHFGVLNYGLLIIAALVTCRFFDTDMSFVLRGLLFVGVGVGFFLTNYYMLKKQKSKTNSLKQ